MLKEMTVWTQDEDQVLFHAYWNGKQFIIDEILPEVKNDVQKWIDYGLCYWCVDKGPLNAEQIRVATTDYDFLEHLRKYLTRCYGFIIVTPVPA